MTGVTLRLAGFAATAAPGADEGHAAPGAASLLAGLIYDTGFADLGDAGGRAEGVAVGTEIGARLEASLYGHVEGGWDAGAAALAVGAAAAAARARGLTAEHAAQALSVAATQASGFAAYAGTPLGDYQRRHAVARGVEAAALVAAGLTAPATGIEGRRGLGALLAPSADLEGLARDLGEVWISRGGRHAES